MEWAFLCNIPLIDTFVLMKNVEKYIKRAANLQRFPFYSLVVLALLLPLVPLFKGNSFEVKDAVTMPLSLLIVAGGYYLFSHRKMKSASYWVKKINESPEELLWLKPISVKHKLGYVLTIAETPRFELYDNQNNRVKFDLPTTKRGLVLKELMEKIPNAHFGYSKEVEKAYRKHRKEFIAALEKDGNYFPLKNYQL